MSTPLRSWTEADFEALSWHDDTLWGVALCVGDPFENDWTSDLVLDIDHIVEWVPGADGIRFRVAPATLRFHGVTDLGIAMRWPDSGFSCAPCLPTIRSIERAPVPEQRVHLDRTYYSWRIVLNETPGSEIHFGAVAFTQTLRRDPLLLPEQQLPRSQR